MRTYEEIWADIAVHAKGGMPENFRKGASWLDALDELTIELGECVGKPITEEKKARWKVERERDWDAVHFMEALCSRMGC